MAKLAIKKASTDVTTYVFIQDSSKTTGVGLAGLAYNTGSLVGYYVRPKGGATAITLATQTVTGDHSDGGFVEIDATNMPGVYRLDLPDAVCATGVPSVVVMLKGATNMSPVVLEIQLTDFDLNTAAITVDGIADAVWDEATADHTTASSFGALDANVDAILADTGTDGVKIAGTQGAITWGQQKIIADADGEGALDIVNTGDGGGGVGVHTEGQYAGQFNEATGASSSGVHNIGIYSGQLNRGESVGVVNDGAANVVGFDSAIATASKLQTVDDNVDSILADTGTDGVVLKAAGLNADAVTEIQSGLALEATLTAIKGAGWTNQTLVKIVTDIAAIQAGSGATPQQIWEYATRVLTAGTNIDLSALATATDLATVDTVVDAIKAKTDTITGLTAQQVWEYVTRELTSAGAGGATAQEVWEYATRVLTAGTNLPTAASVADAVWDEAIVDHSTVGSFGAKNQKVVPSETVGDYKADVSGLATAAALTTVDNEVGVIDGIVDAIKAKTDNLPASPAAVGSAMTLTAAYDKAKDDVLTPLAVVDGIVDAIKVQTDKIPASPASAGEYTTNIGAIKAKTDNLPASPASAGEYTSALTAIQNDLDNPSQYKADVSNLALQATSLAIKGQTDKIPAAPAQTGEYNAALTAIQADLDNPTQYKADVSALATQASVNAIPTTPLLAANYVAPDNASIAAILEDTGTTIPATLAGLATSTEVGAITMLDEVVVGSYTMQDILKILAAKMVGKATGGGTATITYRGVDDTSDVIIETVDSNGNRSAVTLTV